MSQQLHLFFFNFRSGVHRKFSSLFGKSNRELEAKYSEEKPDDRFAWFSVLDTLANGEPIKYEEASRLNAMFAFTYLSYRQHQRNQAQKK